MRRAILRAASLGLLLGAAAAAGATDYSKRARPIDESIRAALLGKWTNPVDGLVIDIRSIDPVTGQLGGKEWPTSALLAGSSAAGTEHDIIGWVNAAPSRPDMDNVVTISFSTSLFEYGTLPSWSGFLRDGRIVTMHYLVWPNRTYKWDHISAYQETWTRVP
jgi:hypothetical protein